ncbi:MAG: rod shape-determining protein MreC [Myxococcota bacterium]
MLDFLKRQRTSAAVLLAVLLPVIVYRVHSTQEAAQNPLDRLILFASAPIERFLSNMVVSVAGAWSSYVDVRGAREENISLRRQLLTARWQQASTEGLVSENARLRTALELAEKNPKLELLAASVTALSASPSDQVVRIDRGLGQGVRRGMAVIGAAGLVGRIQRVGYNYAEVQLITDEKSSLDVAIGRTRVRGRLKGAGLWPQVSLRVLHVLRTEDVRTGDWVLTSGLAGVYPRGVPVGTVSKVDASPDGQELAVEVLPAVDFTRIEEVQVVVGPPPTEEPKATPEILLPRELLATVETSSRSAPRPSATPSKTPVRLIPGSPAPSAKPSPSPSPSKAHTASAAAASPAGGASATSTAGRQP